ncbi:MAG: hypothetical protein AAF443_04355 [Chlamydiota bacterium]
MTLPAEKTSNYKIFNYSDYIPLVSTVTSLRDLYHKYVTLPQMQAKPDMKSTLNDLYYRSIEKKSIYRCVFLLIPFIGNIAVALSDFFASTREETPHAKQRNSRLLKDIKRAKNFPTKKFKLEGKWFESQPTYGKGNACALHAILGKKDKNGIYYYCEAKERYAKGLNPIANEQVKKYFLVAIKTCLDKQKKYAKNGKPSFDTSSYMLHCKTPNSTFIKNKWHQIQNKSQKTKETFLTSSVVINWYKKIISHAKTFLSTEDIDVIAQMHNRHVKIFSSQNNQINLVSESNKDASGDAIILFFALRRWENSLCSV